MLDRSLPRQLAIVLLLLPNASVLPAVAEQAAPDIRDSDAAELTFPGKEMHDAIRRLMKHYEESIQREPDQATHFAGLADACMMLWCFGYVQRDEVLPTMRNAAQQAVRMDGDSAAARTALGLAMLSQWDWSGAERELQLAVELEPDRAASRQWYALYLAAMGHSDLAHEQVSMAVELDNSPGMKITKGAVLYFRRDWPALIELMRQVTREAPDFAPAYDWLGMAYCQQLRWDDSIEVYQKSVELSGGLAEMVAGLGHAYGLAGKEHQARDVLGRLERTDARWYVPPVQIAFVHIGLGQHDEAFVQLERAMQEHSWELVFAGVEPWLDPIHHDPRFAAIIKKLDFPENANVTR